MLTQLIRHSLPTWIQTKRCKLHQIKEPSLHPLLLTESQFHAARKCRFTVMSGTTMVTQNNKNYESIELIFCWLDQRYTALMLKMMKLGSCSNSQSDISTCCLRRYSSRILLDYLNRSWYSRSWNRASNWRRASGARNCPMPRPSWPRLVSDHNRNPLLLQLYNKIQFTLNNNRVTKRIKVTGVQSVYQIC